MANIQVGWNIDTQVPCIVYGVKDLSVHSVLVVDWPTGPGYVQDLTLGWIN